MRTLGTVMIVVGVLMMLTFIFLIPGGIIAGVGALIRIAAGPKVRPDPESF